MKKVLLLTPLLLAACGESDDVAVIKNQVINELDPSRTLGNALEYRDRCSSYGWEESTDSAGRNVVTYTCQMKAKNSNVILQSSFDQMIDSTESSISTYKTLIAMAAKAAPCIYDDEYSVRACELMRNGKLKEIAASEEGIKRFEALKDNDIDKVTQVISWSVVRNTPPSAVMLSAKYIITMDDGKVHELKQGREVLSDVYINNENFSPVINMARYLAPPICINCVN